MTAPEHSSEYQGSFAKLMKHQDSDGSINIQMSDNEKIHSHRFSGDHTRRHTKIGVLKLDDDE